MSNNPFVYFAFVPIFTGVLMIFWIKWHTELKDLSYKVIIEKIPKPILWGIPLVFIGIGTYFAFIVLLS